MPLLLRRMGHRATHQERLGVLAAPRSEIKLRP